LLQSVLAGVLVLAFAVAALAISSRTLERQEATFLNNTARRMVESFEQEWEEEHSAPATAAAVLQEDAPLGIRVDIMDQQGRLLASTANGPRATHEMRAVRVHAPHGAWIEASLSTAPRRRALEALGLALLLAGLPLWMAISFAGQWLARRALSPLPRMAAEADAISASGAVRPLGRADDPGEVAVLAASFDRLVARLDEMVSAERHFAEDAAHELRTPLTVVSGEVEYALSDAALAERHRDGLTRAAAQIAAMSELVEALLFLRRAAAGRDDLGAEFAPVNLADLARDTARTLLAGLPQRAADVRVDAPDEVLVTGHAVLLASALRNLIGNALKFTDAGQPVRVTVRAANAASLVRVEDGGTGVRPEDRDAIFDPFYRSPEARATQAGFGLGLPILRRVARAHGGDVTLSTASLGGAGFELRLPAWRPSA
jgi:signal transduction histidine kinase